MVKWAFTHFGLEHETVWVTLLAQDPAVDLFLENGWAKVDDFEIDLNQCAGEKEQPVLQYCRFTYMLRSPGQLQNLATEK